MCTVDSESYNWILSRIFENLQHIKLEFLSQRPTTIQLQWIEKCQKNRYSVFINVSDENNRQPYIQIGTGKEIIPL